MSTHRPLLLAGTSVWTDHPSHITAPWDGRVVSRVSRATLREAEHAAAAAAAAFDRTRAIPSRRRAAVLRRAAVALEGRRDALVALLRDEGGKPVRYGRDEVTRAVHVLERCATEAERIDGAVLPMLAGRSEASCDEPLRTPALPMGARGPSGSASQPVYLRRCVARGPVLAVTLDHAPLLTACQRVGAAIAAGCPIVVLPASSTPSAPLVLGEILLAAGLETSEFAGALSVLPTSAEVVDAMVTDARFAAVVLTGRGRWAARARAGRRQVRIDPGARANAIVERDADLDIAIPLLVEGAFAHAGQASAGVQRILVDAALLPEVRARLAAATAAVRPGDPARDDVVCGPLVDGRRMERLCAWMDAAAAAGFSRVVGGERHGDHVLAPTIFEHPDTREAPPACGPLVVLQPYRALDAALAALGASGPAAATELFTRSRSTLWHAFDRLDAGTLIHNDYPGRRLHGDRGEEADARAEPNAPRALVEDLMEVRTVVWG